MQKTYKNPLAEWKEQEKNHHFTCCYLSHNCTYCWNGNIFAPAIAVSLFGSEFTGLYGVALTNATLAYIGGGAIVTGGAGILGGQSIIAGGGAILGLAGGGLTTSAVTISKTFDNTRRESCELLK